MADPSRTDGPAAPTEEQRALARLYDLDLADDPGDLDLYLALARRTGGPVLELAVGTGRVAAALAADGHDVVGIDLDPGMLERARRRVAAAAAGGVGRVELVQGDLLEATAAGRGSFRLAFIALNTLFLLATRGRQRAALAALTDHLAPGGLAVIDIWIPDAEDLGRFDGRLVLEYEREDPETDRRVTKTVAARHDPATNVVDLTAIYDEWRPGEPTTRWIRHDALRLVGADELRALAEDVGLVVEQIGGGYDLEPFGRGSERAILLATRV